MYSADFQEMIQHFTRVTAAGKSDRQFLRIDLFYSVSDMTVVMAVVVVTAIN